MTFNHVNSLAVIFTRVDRNKIPFDADPGRWVQTEF